MIRIHVASLLVQNQDNALAFYTEKLGFVKKTEVPLGEHRWLTVVSPQELNGVELLLEPIAFEPAKSYQKALKDAGIPLTSFMVDDVDHQFERLKASGVSFSIEPMNAGPVRIAVLDDTCGNNIQLVQML
jgi:catechol 2,3-dioxygenase-like lactoylglutathione lyase family enzyme